MNLKFWQKKPPAAVETRSYTSNYQDVILQAALGASEQAIEGSRPAVIEACAGLWARGFASAVVLPETPATAALTPSVLASIGRRLFDDGEILFEIVVSDGGVKLLEAASHEIFGTDPIRWRYRLDIPTPEAIIRRTRAADAVVHLRYSTSKMDPWYGTGPVENSTVSKRLAAALELRLSQEANTPVGNVVPSPDTAQDSGLQADLKAMTGGNVLVPSMRSEAVTGGQTPPRNDWQPQRLGANWPASLQPIRADVADHIMGSAGVPAALMSRQVDGSGRREAWRIFLHGTIDPIAKLMQEELREKLDTPDLSLRFDQLHASDIQGRARSFSSMVQGGMAPAQAARVSGLIDDESEFMQAEPEPMQQEGQEGQQEGQDGPDGQQGQDRQRQGQQGQQERQERPNGRTR